MGAPINRCHPAGPPRDGSGSPQVGAHRSRISRPFRQALCPDRWGRSVLQFAGGPRAWQSDFQPFRSHVFGRAQSHV